MLRAYVHFFEYFIVRSSFFFCILARFNPPPYISNLDCRDEEGELAPTDDPYFINQVELQWRVKFWVLIFVVTFFCCRNCPIDLLMLKIVLSSAPLYMKQFYFPVICKQLLYYVAVVSIIPRSCNCRIVL